MSENINKEVVAVIPTYNSCELVCDRVKQLQQYDFGQIIVCDDDSSDDTVKRLREEFGDSIKLIAGSDNLGPAGNRNRCLKELSGNEIVFFIDADCELLYEGDFRKLFAEVFKDKKIGVVGLNINSKENKPMHWNYGRLMNPVYDGKDKLLQKMNKKRIISNEQFIKWAPERTASLRLVKEKGLKEVGWVAEGCMVVRAKVLLEIDGFASQMRYHETHDFCARIKKTGYKVVFCPKLVAKHLEFDTRMKNRARESRAGYLYYYKTHWGIKETVLKKFHIKNK